VGPGKQRPQGSRHAIPFSPQPAPGRARGVARRRLPSGEDQSALIRAMSALVVKAQLTFPFPSQLFSAKAPQLQLAASICICAAINHFRRALCPELKHIALDCHPEDTPAPPRLRILANPACLKAPSSQQTPWWQRPTRSTPSTSPRPSSSE
jgi:hypothetical protein